MRRPNTVNDIHRPVPRRMSDDRPIQDDDDRQGYWWYVCLVGVIVYLVWLVTTLIEAFSV